MIKFHKRMFIVGCILTGLGVLAGLPALMLGYEDIGKLLIMLAPLGMLLMFTGLVVVVMVSPNDRAREQDIPD